MCSVGSVCGVLWYCGGFVMVGQFSLLYCCYVYVVGLQDVCQFCVSFVHSICIDLCCVVLILVVNLLMVDSGCCLGWTRFW